MTYHRDGSPFVMTQGLAYPNIVNYGWLTRYVPFATGDGSGWEPFKELADTVRLWITRGHHECELCGWDNADHGNGEIWLRMGKQTVRFPRMIWHYIKEHRYVLPASVMSAIYEKQYITYSDGEIDEELHVTGNTCIAVSHVRCVAKWKEERYWNLMTFQNANGLNWHFNSCFIRDGFYVAELYLLPELIGIRFEADPTNFPDAITTTTVIGPTPAAGG
jgi:hypothetical protein